MWHQESDRSTLKYTPVHKRYTGYILSSSESYVVFWTNYNNKERELKSITFCNKPKVASSTLCLSVLNAKVAKTAQAGSPPHFCISQIIMSSHCIAHCTCQ